MFYSIFTRAVAEKTLRSIHPKLIMLLIVGILPRSALHTKKEILNGMNLLQLLLPIIFLLFLSRMCSQAVAQENSPFFDNFQIPSSSKCS